MALVERGGRAGFYLGARRISYGAAAFTNLFSLMLLKFF